MRVYKRGKWWWGDFTWIDERHAEQRWRRSLGLEATKPKREAQARCEEIRRGLHALSVMEEHGVLLPSKQELPSCAFSGLAKVWLDHRKAEVKANSLRRYDEVVRLYLASHELLGDRQVSEITYMDIMKVRSDLSERLAPNSTNQALVCLFRILRLGLRAGYLTSDPTEGVSLLPKPKASAWDWYNHADTAAFLDSAEAVLPHRKIVYHIALRAGLRLGEILALEWGDLDFISGEIAVRRTVTRSMGKGEQWCVGDDTKGREDRQVPMPADLREALRQHKHLRGDLVVCGPKGERLTHRGFEAGMKIVARHAGLRRLRFHDLRHSYASALACAGVSLQIIAQLLGHRSIKTTMVYAHLAPSALRCSVEAVFDGTKEVQSPRLAASNPDAKAVRQTASTMPTIVASTGTNHGSSASAASRLLT